MSRQRRCWSDEPGKTWGGYNKSLLLSFIHSVAVARRARDDEEFRVGSRTIEHAMRNGRVDFGPFARRERVLFAADLDDERTREHIEELPRSLVTMADFGGAGRHPLLDDAQALRKMQHPAVAGVAPSIMTGA